ncbi:hypothetical protein KSP40_PGU006332 [Platanthera guangdongensis]|uniref:Uncharacterized protein n=1 Tax=Platanthera guangdongensis TaxID=2320717 RepID=A0ABR2N446_9ASPA
MEVAMPTKPRAVESEKIALTVVVHIIEESAAWERRTPLGRGEKHNEGLGHQGKTRREMWLDAVLPFSKDPFSNILLRSRKLFAEWAKGCRFRKFKEEGYRFANSKEKSTYQISHSGNVSKKAVQGTQRSFPAEEFLIPLLIKGLDFILDLVHFFQTSLL